MKSCQLWAKDQPKGGVNLNCLSVYQNLEWLSIGCDRKFTFVCVNLPKQVTKSVSRTYKSKDLKYSTLEFWWKYNSNKKIVKTLTEKYKTGFSIKWNITDGNEKQKGNSQEIIKLLKSKYDSNIRHYEVKTAEKGHVDIH